MGFLRDEHGKLSISRLVTSLFVIAFFISLAWHSTVPEYFVSSITSVILISLGGLSARTAIANLKGKTNG